MVNFCFKCSNFTPFASYLSYFHLSGSESVFGIRIRIHKVPEYGSNLDLDLQLLYVMQACRWRSTRSMSSPSSPLSSRTAPWPTTQPSRGSDSSVGFIMKSFICVHFKHFFIACLKDALTDQKIGPAPQHWLVD